MTRLEESFGRRVRELRTAINMTQPQLAELIDMSVEWVRRIESGGASPSFDTITALAKALSVRPQDLFAEDAPQPSERLAFALETLSEEQACWLMEGARLFHKVSSGQNVQTETTKKTTAKTSKTKIKP